VQFLEAVVGVIIWGLGNCLDDFCCLIIWVLLEIFGNCLGVICDRFGGLMNCLGDFLLCNYLGIVVDLFVRFLGAGLGVVCYRLGVWRYFFGLFLVV